MQADIYVSKRLLQPERKVRAQVRCACKIPDITLHNRDSDKSLPTFGTTYLEHFDLTVSPALLQLQYTLL